MRKFWLLVLLGVGVAALAGCANSEDSVGETAVSGPALIVFYSDN